MDGFNFIVIAYEISKEAISSGEPDPLFDYIETFEIARTLSVSCYLVFTDRTVDRIYKEVQQCVDGDGQLVVLTVCQPARSNDEELDDSIQYFLK